jgi:hypothetical protein
MPSKTSAIVAIGAFAAMLTAATATQAKDVSFIDTSSEY